MAITMLEYREVSWWYWAATALLLIAALCGWSPGLPMATALSGVQVIHFGIRERSLTAFPVQVRIAYTLWLLVAMWPPLTWLIWVPAIGTPAQVLFGYCTLARCLSLLPWNRDEALSWRLVWRTFSMPPVRGCILQGLPESAG